MVVKRVEVIDELLVIVHRNVGLHLLYACDFLLVATQLLLNLFNHTLVIGNLLLEFRGLGTVRSFRLVISSLGLAFVLGDRC